jgi:hypothetical protein
MYVRFAPRPSNSHIHTIAQAHQVDFAGICLAIPLNRVGTQIGVLFTNVCPDCFQVLPANNNQFGTPSLQFNNRTVTGRQGIASPPRLHARIKRFPYFDGNVGAVPPGELAALGDEYTITFLSSHSRERCDSIRPARGVARLDGAS